MFGQQNDQNDNQQDDKSPQPAASDNPDEIVAAELSTDQASEPEAAKVVQPEAPADAPEAAATPESDDKNWQHPGTPLPGDQDQIRDIISPAGGFPKPPSYQYPSIPQRSASISSDVPSPSEDEDVDPLIHQLIEIKKQALDELAPLIDQLGLDPEEKFRTIMMIIQASDDQALVKSAYAAAHSIEDEKVRAQALLDIVNEINYFTTPHDPQPES